MAQESVIVKFPGNPERLAPRYAEGLRRFRATRPDIRPETIVLGRSDRAPDALVVVILWPEGVDHHVLGGFILEELENIGLERPTAVDHLTVSGVGWDAIAATCVKAAYSAKLTYR